MTQCLITVLTFSKKSFSPTPFPSLDFWSWRLWLIYKVVIFLLIVTVPRGKKYLPFHLYPPHSFPKPVIGSKWKINPLQAQEVGTRGWQEGEHVPPLIQIITLSCAKENKNKSSFKCLASACGEGRGISMYPILLRILTTSQPVVKPQIIWLSRGHWDSAGPFSFELFLPQLNLGVQTHRYPGATTS